VNQRWETGRVEAFSDGVFAIAITLLVLDIRIEPEQYAHLLRALLDEWSSYFAYVTSFFTVGSVWIAHHSLFTRLKYIDSALLRLNLVLLLVAAFLPFPTAVLSQAFEESTKSERAAVAFYGVTALAIELILRAMIRYASTKPELVEGEVPAPLPKSERGWRATIGTAGYTLAIAFGVLLLPHIAGAFYLLIALRGVLVSGHEGRLSIRLSR
jgi:TMEM175 potassium channel family protein